MRLWLVFLRREASALRQLHLEANNPSHPRRFVTVDRENPGWPEPNPGLGRVSRGGLKNCSSTPVTRPRAERPRLASTNMPRCRATVDFPPSWTRFCSGKAVGAGLSMLSSPHLPRKQVCKSASQQKRWVPCCWHTQGLLHRRAPELCLCLAGPQQPAFVIRVTGCVTATALLGCGDTL